MEEEKTYLLYSNKKQDNLLAMAYSKDELYEVTDYYSKGVWFEYDNVPNTSGIENERLYSEKVKFPKTVKKKEVEIKKEKEFSWIK